MESIGIDLDNVLADSWDLLLPFLNKKFGTKITKISTISYRLSEVFGVSAEEIVKAYEDIYREGIFLKSAVIVGAAEAVNKLNEKYKLSILTSRPYYMKEHTLQWIEKNFPELLDNVHFTSHPTELDDGTLIYSKCDICLQNNIGIMVDDCLEDIAECKNNGIRGFLFDLNGKYGWNKREAEGIERFHSWQEVVDKLI